MADVRMLDVGGRSFLDNCLFLETVLSDISITGTSGAWRTYTAFNTTKVNSISGVLYDYSTGKITIPPGRYFVFGHVITLVGRRLHLRLYHPDLIVVGGGSYSNASVSSTTIIMSFFDNNIQRDFELQYLIELTSTAGLAYNPLISTAVMGNLLLVKQ